MPLRLLGWTILATFSDHHTQPYYHANQLREIIERRQDSAHIGMAFSLGLTWKTGRNPEGLRSALVGDATSTLNSRFLSYLQEFAIESSKRIIIRIYEVVRTATRIF
jgi:hypothetical protein